MTEQQDLMIRFVKQLWAATGDGAKKRQAGTKVPWYVDEGHEAAMFRHLARWKTDPGGTDPDSGAHHLVAVAWRALAIAAIETGDVPADSLRSER